MARRQITVRVIRNDVELGEGTFRGDGLLLLEENILSVGDEVILVGKNSGLSYKYEVEERLCKGLYRMRGKTYPE